MSRTRRDTFNGYVWSLRLMIYLFIEKENIFGYWIMLVIGEDIGGNIFDLLIFL